MKIYNLVYTSNNGDVVEVKYTGTMSMLLLHIKALEAYGMHSMYATDGRTPVYANNRRVTPAGPKSYDVTFTGNDGSEQEHDHYGTVASLVEYITALEELGCHGITAMDGDTPVYEFGGLL